MTKLQIGPESRRQVSLASVFAAECVELIPHGSGKQAVLEQLVNSIATAGKLPQTEIESVVGSLVEREKVGTTGMGKGLAIPNLRTRAVTKCVGAVGKASDGMDFESLDGLPTRLILLVLSPVDQREQHAAILGRLARLLRDRTWQYQVQIRQPPKDVVRRLLRILDD